MRIILILLIFNVIIVASDTILTETKQGSAISTPMPSVRVNTIITEAGHGWTASTQVLSGQVETILTETKQDSVTPTAVQPEWVNPLRIGALTELTQKYGTLVDAFVKEFGMDREAAEILALAQTNRSLAKLLSKNTVVAEKLKL